MRPTLLLLILTLLAPLTAAEKPTAPAAAAAATLAPGTYVGSWRAQDESTGTLRLKFSQGADQKWQAEAMFTYEGAEVPTATKAFKLEGGRVELTFSWEVQGVNASSTLKGEIQAGSLSGTYQSTVNEAASSGRWTVALQPAKS
ncbi:MAG: hypothetical protein FJ397_02275 [Verrucomicrobia bacterium]|nr:hypothetical protein [Verrucomicrobiota bacterium]